MGRKGVKVEKEGWYQVKERIERDKVKVGRREELLRGEEMRRRKEGWLQGRKKGCMETRGERKRGRDGRRMEKNKGEKDGCTGQGE